MSTTFVIDPGPTDSAFVILDANGEPCRHGKHENGLLKAKMVEWYVACPHSTLVIEMIASYGMPVGREVFDTCVWIGRFLEAWPGIGHRVYRKEVKLHLCGQTRAKDANIRAALIDLWGGKDKAIGKKAKPGPLYGMTSDVWAALALAVTWRDLGRQVAS